MGFSSASQIIQGIADRARAERIRCHYTQAELAERSGVPLSTYKRFEREGQIALESLAKVAIALRMESELNGLFEKTAASFESLDAVERSLSSQPNKPRRVRHTSK
jgi:transcriptional regulator with XRE-family HTH domain